MRISVYREFPELYVDVHHLEHQLTMSGALSGQLTEAVAGSRVLVVGTGGIGCELLKNLVLTGFQNIVAVSS